MRCKERRVGENNGKSKSTWEEEGEAVARSFVAPSTAL
jgi:hypothetical protein